MESELGYMGPVIAFDLDDTLYREQDFVRTGFAAVARMALTQLNSSVLADMNSDELLRKMMDVNEHGENAFDWLAKYASPDCEQFIKECVRTYRFHTPQIEPSPGVKELLSVLAARGVRMAIITDGRSRTQRNKLAALGLEQFFDADNILISEESGHVKTDIDSWQRLVRRYPNATRFVYIGDNPVKDFRIPNLMGWVTVGIRDDGSHIHPQSPDLPSVQQPQIWVENINSISLDSLFIK